VLKHFTARDVVSRYDVLEVHTQARATTAAHFLDALESRMPFPIRAIQVDGGSEYQAEFETECQKRALLLYVLPPRSPKLNGAVERAQRTHTEEFYEVYDGDLEIKPLNSALQGWEYVYNHVRPHQSLAYLTPVEFLALLLDDELDRRNQSRLARRLAQSGCDPQKTLAQFDFAAAPV